MPTYCALGSRPKTGTPEYIYVTASTVDSLLGASLSWLKLVAGTYRPTLLRAADF